MKVTIYILFSLLLLSCSDDDNNDVDPVDQLPPATQSGENTFGCLIDGEVFIADGGGPLGGPNADGATSYYQYVCDDGECFHFFNVAGNNENYENVYINIRNTIQEGETILLSLENFTTGQFYNQIHEYTTRGVYRGTITFTSFDEQNQIASGTFEFEAVNENGETVNITDGRFDIDFTI